LATDYRSASASSAKRIPFALGTKDALEGARVAVKLYGAEHVRKVHALALADALRGRIPVVYYSRLFIGGGFAARMTALESHHGAMRATAPVRTVDTHEDALSAFVRASVGEAPSAPALPEPPLARAQLDAGPEKTRAGPEPPRSVTDELEAAAGLESDTGRRDASFTDGMEQLAQYALKSWGVAHA
jgi:hypothetical protein